MTPPPDPLPKKGGGNGGGNGRGSGREREKEREVNQKAGIPMKGISAFSLSVFSILENIFYLCKE